ncbi:MAG: endolytic transglycosylase MltG [Tissierellia bacterium]|nr:endolytic transglycosylase MltG [Tissierellia bacterium]
MKKTGDKLFDFLYNIMDYIIIVGILAIVILIISMKLDILFEDDNYTKPAENVVKVENNLEDTKEESDIIEASTGIEADANETTTGEEEKEDSSEVSIGSIESVDKDSQSQTSSGEVIKVTIPSGSPTLKTGQILVDKGLIKDAKEFEKKAIETGFDRKIKAGSFDIPKGTNLDEIFKIISKTK